MTEIARLLAEYVSAHQAGEEADPLVYLDRVDSESDRVLLAGEIDRYLTSAPRRAFDAALFNSSSAAQTVVELERALAGRAGLWPAVLPPLRARAGVKRSALVERLASALGVSERSEKVASYYHAMEQGLLDSSGVSDKVLSALAAIVGAPAELLRDAGRPLLPPAAGAAALTPAFTRRAAWADSAEASTPPTNQAESWDEVDELFTGKHSSDADTPSD